MKRWINRAGLPTRPIISDVFLGGVTEAFDACREMAFRMTLPVVGEKYRIFNGYADWMEGRWQESKERLHEAQMRLQKVWPEVIAEATGRWGREAREEYLPSPDKLVGLWRVDVNIWDSDSMPLTTLDLLGHFSRYYARKDVGFQDWGLWGLSLDQAQTGQQKRREPEGLES